MYILIEIISLLFQIYMLMLFARVISSWVPELQATKPMQFIAFYTDPYLNLFRRIIPTIGFLDISPIFAFLALELIKIFILRMIV